MAAKTPKRTSTRTARATASTKKASKSATNAAETADAAPAHTTPALPSSINITKRTAGLLWQNKAVLGLITMVHIVLYLLFVQGVSGLVDVAAIRDQFADKFAGGISAYLQLVSGASSTGVTQAAQVYQMITLVIISLATIWALRQIIGGVNVRTRDAFYKGMYPLVPFLLVMLVVILELLPSFLGLTIYQLVVVSGIAGAGIGQLFWGLLALILTLVSLYLIASSLFAAIIVTLPDMTPVSALRSASKLVRGRRWKVLRKVLFMPLVLFLASAIILLPVIMIVPVLAQWLFIAVATTALTASITYLYVLYRDLLNE